MKELYLIECDLGDYHEFGGILEDISNVAHYSIGNLTPEVTPRVYTMRDILNIKHSYFGVITDSEISREVLEDLNVIHVTDTESPESRYILGLLRLMNDLDDSDNSKAVAKKYMTQLYNIISSYFKCGVECAEELLLATISLKDIEEVLSSYNVSCPVRKAVAMFDVGYDSTDTVSFLNNVFSRLGIQYEYVEYFDGYESKLIYFLTGTYTLPYILNNFALTEKFIDINIEGNTRATVYTETGSSPKTETLNCKADEFLTQVSEVAEAGDAYLDIDEYASKFPVMYQLEKDYDFDLGCIIAYDSEPVKDFLKK